ncbi:MAG: tetratricopeptide repeat protein [Capsulimonadaceae bacterium]|nr:tetratricopeptide repeat protein [Capsulimonadaceae bacterium]
MVNDEQPIVSFQDLPYRTATFLYTDIEGSTQAWQKSPVSEVRNALLSVEDIIRRRVQSHGGRVFRSTGDGLCAVFDDPLNAVMSAVGAQQDLQAPQGRDTPFLPARMAVSTGGAWERGDEFYGVCAHLVARILDLGHGGQILACAQTSAAVNARAPGGVLTKPLGSYYLRGFNSPQDVYQITHSSLRGEFPPLRSTKSAWTNIPAETDSFVGRASELAKLDAAFSSGRLLTLLGPGGIGKTRLAIHWALTQTNLDGSWLIELAALTEQTLVAQTIARTLGIKEDASIPSIISLCQEIGMKATMLVLDNCEHVLIGCAAAVERLLKECPNLRVLATSREPLSIAGERHLRLSSLASPTQAGKKREMRPDTAESIALFVDRAAAVHPGFTLNEDNVVPVTKICERIDGVPLAIELAAARLRSMSVDDLWRRLEADFSVLRTARESTSRRKTIQDTIRWSFRLLTPEELTFLMRLSVFAGGCSLDAAADVCSTGLTDKDGAEELMAELVDKSLVMFRETASGSRYHMLEAIRELAYADFKQTDEHTELLRAHSRWAVRLAEDIEGDLWSRQAAAVMRTSDEIANFRAVMTRSLGQVDSEYGVRVCAALYRYWTIQGMFKEPTDWLARLLDIPNALISDEVFAIAYSALGGLARSTGDLDLSAYAFEESLALWQARENMSGIADCLNNLGLIASDRGEYARAADLLNQALQIQRQRNDVAGESACLLNLGFLSLASGQIDVAMKNFERSIDLDRSANDAWGIAAASDGLGRIWSCVGDMPKARRFLKEGLSIRLGLSDRPGIIESIESIAQLCTLTGKIQQAAVLLGACEAGRASLGAPLPALARPAIDDALSRVRKNLNPTQFAMFREQGRDTAVNELAVELLSHMPEEP